MSSRRRGQCDLASEFAAPFAIGVAGDMLGLSLDDVPRIRGFYDAFAGGMVYDGDPEPQRRADAARAELSALLLDELARSRRDPDASVTSAVVCDPATGLSDDDIVAQLRVILFGAIETIESMVLNTVMLLLDHPDQLAAGARRSRADSQRLGGVTAADPAGDFLERWSSAPVAVGDVELGVGEFVGVSTLGANRDPAVFADPLRFDIRRPNARHGLSFSSRGAPLRRLLDGPDAGPARRGSDPAAAARAGDDRGRAPGRIRVSQTRRTPAALGDLVTRASAPARPFRQATAAPLRPTPRCR